MIRQRTLLNEDQFENPKVIFNLNLMKLFSTFKKVMKLIRYDSSLETQQEYVHGKSDSKFQLKDGLLLHDNERLVVPDNDNICTALEKEAHDQSSTAHPRCKKTLRLLTARYYWPNMIIQMLITCHVYCTRVNHDKNLDSCFHFQITHINGNKFAGILKKCPKTTQVFNIVVVFIDRLSKRAITISYKKTFNARNLAESISFIALSIWEFLKVSFVIVTRNLSPIFGAS